MGPKGLWPKEWPGVRAPARLHACHPWRAAGTPVPGSQSREHPKRAICEFCARGAGGGCSRQPPGARRRTRAQLGAWGGLLGTESVTLGAHFASPLEMSPKGSLTRPTAKYWTSCPPGNTCRHSWPRARGKSLRKS